jgi:uncharacterized protein
MSALAHDDVGQPRFSGLASATADFGGRMFGTFSTRIGGVWLATLCAASLTSGAASAQSFDCAKASPPIETAICASADLRAKDNALAGAYSHAQFLLRDDAAKLDALKQAQRAWIAGRNRACAADPAKLESCLAAAYGARLAAIAQAAPTQTAQPATPPQAAPVAPHPVAATPVAPLQQSPAQAPQPTPPPPAAQPSAPVVAAAPIAIQPASVPADRDASALITIPAPGRYSIRAKSATGVAIQLVDMIAGPGDVAGAAGVRDGRLDLLLDKGVYKIRTTGAKGATAPAALEAQAFRDVAPPTQLTGPQTGDLGDLQQRSYWIDVDTSGRVAIEALGRALQDFRLWRNGEELADLQPEAATIETKAGRPMTRLRLEGNVEPGRYLATAYGGENAVWPDGGADKPFMVRPLTAASLAAGVAEGAIGPFGSARFSAPPDMDTFRIETAEPAPVRMNVRRAGTTAAAVIAKNSRDPFANTTLAAAKGEPATVEVSGLAGQAFRLRALHASNNQRVAGAGPTFVIVDVAGEGGDEIPATALFVRFDNLGKSRVVAADAPRIGAGQAWRGRFNLRGASTLLFEMTSPGPVAVRTQGPAARVTIEPVLGATQPRADGKTPALWNLEAGVYQIRIAPVNGAAGLFDLTFGQPGQLPDLAPPPAPRSAISFGQQQIDRNASYDINANSAPGLLVGVRTLSSPVDLAKGPVAIWQGVPVSSAAPVPPPAPKPAPVTPPQPAPQKQGAAPVAPVKPASVTAPAPKPQPLAQAPTAQPAPPPVSVAPPSGDLKILARAPLGGTITVRDQRGADVPFSIVEEPAQPDHRTFTLTVSGVSTPRALAIAWSANVRNQALLAKPQAALETIAAGEAKFFDLAEGHRREFRMEAKEGGLYRIETLGRLVTSLSVGTNFLPHVARAEDNGAGHNALAQAYLRAGSYRVSVQAKDSTGRVGLSATPATMTTTGILSANGSVRATLAAGRGAIAPIEIREAGNYRLDLYSLGAALPARLEDAEGWPLTAPGPLSRLDLKLEAGKYRLVVPPVDLDARMVARLRPVVTPPALEGHGPHPLAFGDDRKFQWREPQARDEPRKPDLWTFGLAGETNVDLSISEGMIGEVFRGERESVAKLTASRSFSGKLAAGAYRVEARAIGRDDRLDYTLSLASDDLQPGVAQFVDLPAKLSFAIAGDRVVNLTTFGRKDLKGVLRDANGAIVERIAGRADDWNIALARRLSAGRYTLSLSAMTANPTPADDAATDDQADDEPSSDDAADANADANAPAEQEESGVEVRLALPAEVDQPALAADAPAKVSGAQAFRFPLSPAPAGSLAMVAARSAAELALSIETRETADAPWRVVGFERAQAPLVAWPAPAQGKTQWRASVWSIDGATAPIDIVARAIARNAQDSGAVALEPASPAGDAVGANVRVGLARAASAAIVNLATASGSLYAGSSEGHALARVEAGPLAPQSERLWLLSRDESLKSVSAPALAWNGEQIALALDAGETAILPAPAPPAGKARVWRVRSAFGQPGLDASRGMAVAENFASVLDTTKPLRIWNADGGDALRVELASVDLTLLPKAQATADFSTLLPPRSALPLSLAAGDKRLEIDLAADTAAFSAPEDSDRLAVATLDQAVSRTLVSGAKDITLVNASDRPRPVRIVSAPGKRDVLTPGGVFKRFFGAGGSLALRVEAANGDVLRVEGADATYVSQTGAVPRGATLTLDGPGEVTLDYKPGLVAAWIERAGASPWPKAEARAASLPLSAKLEGPAMAFALKQDQPVLLALRTSAPVAVSLEQNGRRELKLFPAGAEYHRYLAAGEAQLAIYSPHDGPLSGALDMTASPVTPAKDGLGDPVALSPGASALFGFEVKRTAEIGVGLRAEPDRVDVRLIDATGKSFGEGVAQIVKLEPGRYFIEARVPVDAPATTVRPAIVGLAPPPAGPPPEQIAKYLAAAGLKTNAK